MVLNIAIKIIQNKYFINKKDIRNEQNDLHTLFLDFLEFEMKKSINRKRIKNQIIYYHKLHNIVKNHQKEKQ